MTTANLQEEKKVDFLPKEELDKNRKPLPWWVLLYFNNHEVGVHHEEQAAFSNGLLAYFIWWDIINTCWYIRADFIYDDKRLDPLFTTPVFCFPIPPTEEKFLQVMQVLDIQ